MNRNAEALLEQADACVHLFDRVSAGGRFEGASSDGPIRLLTDQELLESTAKLAALHRLVQAELTKHAADIARRSEPRDDTSLARRMGAGSAANLVSQVTGVPRAQAGTMVASGIAFRPRENPFTGEPLPAVCPQIAAAFADGLLDPEVAAAMRRALAKAAPGLAPYEVDELERQVVAKSQEGYDPDLFLAWLKKVPETAHPDGGAPNPDGPAPIASVTRKILNNGLIQWVLQLDPLTDGLLKTALDANTAMKRSLLATPDEPAPDAETADRRPLAQRRVDGVALLAKQAVKMDDGQVGGTAVTMLVTITEQALKTGLGTAELPDCGTEIPASVARMLAADAEIIPVVLGGRSQPMDLGVGRRYFSEAQRRAMVIRDGGCVGPGVTPHRRGATVPTSGQPGTGRRVSTTGSYSVGDATSSTTNTAGNSNASMTGGGGPHHHGSTPPHGNDPADASHPSTSARHDLEARFARTSITGGRGWRAARAGGGTVVVVDMGWPSADRRFADVATFGGSRAVGAALLRLLTGTEGP